MGPKLALTGTPGAPPEATMWTDQTNQKHSSMFQTGTLHCIRQYVSYIAKRSKNGFCIIFWPLLFTALLIH